MLVIRRGKGKSGREEGGNDMGTEKEIIESEMQNRISECLYVEGACSAGGRSPA